MKFNETAGYVLYEENIYDGVTSVEMYESESEALEALEEIVNEFDSEFVEAGETYAVLEDTVLVCKSIEEAISPESKIVWTTRQNLFLETELPFLYDWNYTYSNEEEAMAYFNDALEQYQEQAETDSSITIKEGDNGRTAYIFKDDYLMVSLVCECAAVGLTGDINTIDLTVL